MTALARLRALLPAPSRDPHARAPETHDLTGRDYAFTPYDDGMRGSVACWSGRKPPEGDYLLLRNGPGSTRYRVTHLNPCWNVDPATMWIARVEFAPRSAPSGARR